MKKRLYLAGKIDCDLEKDSVGWRDGMIYINDNFRKAQMTPDEFHACYSEVPPHDIFEMIGDLDGFIYAGPMIYFWQHSVFGLPGHAGDTSERAPWIKRDCLTNLDSCDIVFAWLNSPDAYGTIYELGFALAADKKIIIGVDDALPEKVKSDLWFVTERAFGTSICYTMGTAKEALIAGLKTIGEYLPSLPYAEYLKTDHWKHVAKQARTAADGKCQLCNNNNMALHVHHRTYDRKGFEKPSDLTVLCEKCHAKFHDKEA